jgi:uncharacterized protein YaiI (UPF0178 family)
MHMWIDADACPKDVKDVVFRASQRTGIRVTLVANKALMVPRTPLIDAVQVAGGPDVADDHLVAHAAAGDVVVTADIPLAARLVERRVVAINPRGELYDEENIRERLSVRDFLADLRDTGVMTGGPAAYGPKDKQRFANALDRVLQGAQRGQP